MFLLLKSIWSSVSWFYLKSRGMLKSTIPENTYANRVREDENLKSTFPENTSTTYRRLTQGDKKLKSTILEERFY